VVRSGDRDVVDLPALAERDDPVEELVERLGDFAGVPARVADPVELVLGEREHRSRPGVVGLAHVELEVALVRRVERVEPPDQERVGVVAR
jgi:hypothetical protein